MTLLFPNSSRSFDEKRNAVRFLGHEGMFEVRFFVEADALVAADAELGRSKISESKLLSAFDALRSSVYDVARKATAVVAAIPTPSPLRISAKIQPHADPSPRDALNTSGSASPLPICSSVS
jgi:hypothetical protein